MTSIFGPPLLGTFDVLDLRPKTPAGTTAAPTATAPTTTAPAIPTTFQPTQPSDLPKLQVMSDFVNNYIKNYLEGAIPGYQNLVQQSAANTASALQGQLPADVINLIGQAAAERGTAIGSPNSPNANAALLRALGLTSLQRSDEGSKLFNEAVARTPKPFDVSSLFITPEQSAQLNLPITLQQMRTNADLQLALLQNRLSPSGRVASSAGVGSVRSPTVNYPTFTGTAAKPAIDFGSLLGTSNADLNPGWGAASGPEGTFIAGTPPADVLNNALRQVVPSSQIYFDPNVSFPSETVPFESEVYEPPWLYGFGDESYYA